MVREGDYYIALNNSTESLKSLMKNHPFDETKLIHFLSKFAEHFNNKLKSKPCLLRCTTNLSNANIVTKK